MSLQPKPEPGRDCLGGVLSVGFHLDDSFRLTATVGCNSCLPHSVDAFRLDQSTKSVESSSSLESADLLLVLAFEEQSDFGVGGGSGSIAVDFVCMRCWLRGYIQPTARTAIGLGRRCNLVECLTGDCGCAVNVFLDSFVGILY